MTIYYNPTTHPFPWRLLKVNKNKTKSPKKMNNARGKKWIMLDFVFACLSFLWVWCHRNRIWMNKTTWYLFFWLFAIYVYIYKLYMKKKNKEEQTESRNRFWFYFEFKSSAWISPAGTSLWFYLELEPCMMFSSCSNHF